MTEDSLSVLSTDPTYTTRALHEDDAAPELKRLKAQRGQKRGYATRLGKKLHTLQLKHPSAVSEATISSLSAELKDCVSKHDLLQQSIDECAADPEAYTPAAEREKHDTIHDELLADLDNLAIQSKAHRDAKLLDLELRRLLALDTAISSQKEEYAAVSKSRASFTTACLTLPEDAELQNAATELDTLFSDLTRLFATVTSSTATTPPTPCSTDSTPRPKMAPLNLDIPKFNGDPLQWQAFEVSLVSLLRHRAEGFTREDKFAIVRQAITPLSGKTLIAEMHQSGSTVDDLLKGLRQLFGRLQLVVPLLVNKVTNVPYVDRTTASIRKFKEAVMGPYKTLQTQLDDKMSLFFPHYFRPFLTGKMKEDWDKLLMESLTKPSMEDFTKFLEKRLLWADNSAASGTPLAFEPTQTAPTPMSKPTSSRPPTNNPPPAKKNFQPAKCPSCGEGHWLGRCATFAALPVDERNKLVREKRLCLNCFSASHAVRNCSNKHSCRHCHQRHHSLLHIDKGPATPSSTPPATTPLSVDMVALSPSSTEGRSVGNFICSVTAMITSGDKSTKARVLIDHGSGASFMSTELADTLKLKRIPYDRTCTGAGLGTITTKFKVRASLRSTISDFETAPLEFLIFPKRMSSSPPQDRESVTRLATQHGLVLSDPPMGGVVDILLGEEHPWDLCGGVTAIDRHRFISTKFGYGVIGPLATRPHVYTILPQDTDLHKDLAKLWSLEKVPESSPLTKDEQKTLQHFHDNVTHSEQRIQVKLPFKDSPPALGDSRKQALSRLFSIEKSLKAKQKLEIFNEALREYIHLGHAHIIPEEEVNKSDHVFYLPVHGIFKATSSTTKVRPVFDASAKSSTGISLNDQLHIGPNLYPHLSDVIIKFRTYSVGLSADIGKMFREILLHPDHQDYHRFLVRLPSGIISDCRMSRVTFGVASSPFLATQSIRYLAEKYKSTHPNAANAVLNQFYVDDFVAGAHSAQEAISLRNELCDLLSKAGMNLRKWRSNSINFLHDTPSDLREEDVNERLHLSQSPKALGMHWDTTTDQLLVAIPDVNSSTTVTKRFVAAISAGVYDILGIFSPFTIQAKLILQEAWKRRLPWDVSLPDNLMSTWSSWVEGLATVRDHAIARPYFECPSVFLSLHGFADASDRAYGAVLYLRAVQADGSIHTSLVTSKARVLPVKHVTVPRAELLGAVLLARLLSSTAKTLGVDHANTHAWSDSTITLFWISKSPAQLKDKFVANRVQIIQDELPATTWRHVSTDKNPADIASRGMTAVELTNSELWWNGPPWLSQPPTCWPETHIARPQEDINVLAITPDMSESSTQSQFLDILWSKYSSLHKLTRVVSWLYRFVTNARNKQNRNLQPQLSSAELLTTHQTLIALAQQQSYPQVYAALSEGKSVSKGHHLYKFTTTIEVGRLMCHSRIRDPENRTQPLRLLPLDVKSKFTILLCTTQHVSKRHPGVSALQATIASTYIIPGLRNLLKKISRACALCQRAYARPVSHLMGMLPAVRSTPTPTFYVTGVDFAGPMFVRQGHVRKPVPVKTYTAVFICMASKAVHLELCASLSSVDFRAALQRFIARRGTPGHIYCDNGSNFLGAREETRDLRDRLESRKTTITFCQTNNIVWHHSPPRAPHFGGLWEAAVRQMKLILKKNLTPHLLRYDELETLLIEAEAILNSRPITPMTQEDEHTGNILTAGHFLIGRPLLATPMLETPEKFTPSLRRWRLVAKIQEDIWQQWLAKYLNTLHERCKWNKSQTPLQVNQLVYLKDETLSHRQWPLAKVQEIFAGDDGQVRAAKVLCHGKNYVRSTTMLIPCLPEEHPLSEKKD